MRNILILLILWMPFVAYSADRHKDKGMPVSRWREMVRMKPDSTIVPFKDTLFISFERKDSFQYHNGYSFIYNGVYSISEDSILDFGTARYKLLKKTHDSLVLANDMGIFFLGVDLSDTVKKIVIDSEKILPVTDIDQMIGHWTVYKRKTKEPGTTIDEDKEIVAVYITGASTDGKLGYILNSHDPVNAPSWYIKGMDNAQVLDCDGKNPRTLKVLKCQKGELILQDEDITYFLKEFK